MPPRLATTLALLLALLSKGCADDAPPPSTTVRFALGEGPIAFGDVPFPSDLYRDEAGQVALGAFPNPKSETPMFEAVRALLATRGGFCTTCNITFSIDGRLDARSLPPPEVLEAGPGFDDGVALVDVDPSSPDFGASVPLRLEWDAPAKRLSIRPARGHTLRGAHRYAAVLTRDLAADDGTALGASPDFAAIRDGRADTATALHAGAVFEPSLVALESLGLERERVVGLAPFTTEAPARDVIAVRAAIAAAPSPVATVDTIFEGPDLDTLLGVPADDGPGVDLVPAAGESGTRAVAHRTTSMVIAGRLLAPRFVTGSGTDVGALTRAPDGTPVASSTDEVPFVLIVPRDVDLTALPVVISQHGFNASRVTGFALADTAGAAGYAVLAIDAFQHGDRAASRRDELHALRGDLEGPDGFAETAQLDVSSRVFGLAGGEPGMELFPGYALAAFTQFAADAMSAVRWARFGSLDAIRQAHPGLAGLAFDPNRITFVGNSMGAVIGTSVVVAAPDISAAVLDVMPGSIVSTLAESGEFRALSTALLLPQIGVDPDFDEIDRAMVFDPTVDLFRWVLEPIDPLALARSLILERDPSAGAAPDLLVQLAGHDEVAAPTASESVVAAAGLPGAGEFSFARVEPIDLPAHGDDVTAVAVRFAGAMHGMLEVHQQASRFEEPLAPPLVARSATATIDNPIDRVHAQIEAFLRTHAEDGHATVVP